MRQMTCFFILFLILSCKNKDKNITPNIKRNKIESIKNKKLSSINSILGDTINNTNKTILLYSDNDCWTCVENSFKIIKTLEERKYYCYVVGINSNAENITNELGYFKPIFNDRGGNLKKELNSIKTPLIIFVNRKNVVINAFIPSYNRSKEHITEENNFIKFITEFE